MDDQQLSLYAGIISTFVFASSNIPMLAKVFRTHDLHSYSLTSLIMGNFGNLVHWVYISGLPFGPIWFLHTFYTVTNGILLFCYVAEYGPFAHRRLPHSDKHGGGSSADCATC